MPRRNSVTVHQLASDSAFVNVLDVAGAVGVWGCDSKEAPSPTYLCWNGNNFLLIQFDSQAWADEWLTENGSSWPIQTRLTKLAVPPATEEPAAEDYDRMTEAQTPAAEEPLRTAADNIRRHVATAYEQLQRDDGGNVQSCLQSILGEAALLREVLAQETEE